MLQRGIVLGPNVSMRAQGETLVIEGRGLDPRTLRHAILYFDKFEWPETNFMAQTSSEFDLLKDAGVMQTTTALMQHTNADPLEAGPESTMRRYATTMETLYDRLLQDMHIDWTFGNQVRLLYQSDENVQQSLSLQLKLTALLPSPPIDVPLVDLLEFKNRRYDEYAELRIYIDELADHAAQAFDVSIASSAALHRMEKALEAVRRVSAETWSDRALSAISIAFRPAQAYTNYLAGVAVGKGLEPFMPIKLSPQLLGAANAARAFIEFNLSRLFQPKALPERYAPFEYVINIDKEFR